MTPRDDHRRSPPGAAHERIRRVATTDGWRLQLRRLTAASPRRPTPLLMLHGFGANSYGLAARKGPSLGHYLASRGIDVWLLDFRGTRTSAHADGRGATERITIDDKILLDLPAAIDMILVETGGAAIDLLGFSLGGTIAYGYLSYLGQSAIRRLVTLAAPLRFALPRGLGVLQRLERNRIVGRVTPRRIPLRGFTALGARTNVILPAQGHFNLANVERSVLRAMMRHGAEDAATSELLQLYEWSLNGRLTSVDGRIDFGAKVTNIDRPVLLIGAAADRHVAPQALIELFTALRAPDKRLVLVGCDTGAVADYGHTDLLLGPAAAVDVFQHVAAWLEGPTPRTTSSGSSGA